MSQTGRAAHLTFRGVIGAFIVAERKQQGAASDLFKLAKSCADVTEFARKCEEAEDFYLSIEAGQMQCKELPRKYIQAKSDIRGGFRAGLDFRKIKSYHAMKNAKAAANASEQAPATHAADVPPVQQGEDQPTVQGSVQEVVILSHDEGKPRQQRGWSGPRKERDANPEITMAEALEQGLVLDAKTNVLMPEDMRPLVVALSKLDQISRARFIKQFTKEVHRALSLKGQVPEATPKQDGVIYVEAG